MLVLSRKIQEMIQIGDDVTITILKVKGQTVRLGIEAPRQVRVIRSELPPNPVSDDRSVSREAGPRTDSSRVTAARRQPEGHRQNPREKRGKVGITAGSSEIGVERSPLASLVQESMRIAPMAAAAH